MSRDRDSALAADGHAGDTNVPALDDFAGAELEGEGLAFLVGWWDVLVFVSLQVLRWSCGEGGRLTVKDLPVLLQLANVPHANFVALLGRGPGT